MKAQQSYDTVSEAISQLARKGYTTDFELLRGKECLVCKHSVQQLSPDEFVIDETHRFEGETDPGDEMILYAISSKKHGLKGILLNAYGTYADREIYEIVARLEKNTKEKPLKRSEKLKPLSREHHHALLLCWKIKTGFAKNIAPERIKAYADWFFENHLKPHFAIEERYLFSVLGDENDLVKRAKREHQQIIELFTSEGDIAARLHDIKELLEQHIRFEERVLFNEIQKQATEQQLDDIEKYHHEEKFIDNLDDPFWE
ncbi:hemerythrin domain-containing protein [Pelobium manganitolerans]|uniref:hemerythrin domain-containing protein n=1 Tax=Pelobium manganitolerans TaxID=1842495 RepID=UPI001C7CB347|nr:hemerythrin domain-containing protein [Pelobium manganitolerans]